jgi:protein SCO1/2
MRSASGFLLAALAAGGVGFAAFKARSAPPLPVLGTLPAFSLTTQASQPLTRADLEGHPWVAAFIFTRCAGICPAITSRMARLQHEVPAGTRLVSFSVDPRHDTPEVLARYARDFHAGPDWLFVTGTQEALFSLAVAGFKLGASEVPPEQQAAGGDGAFLHSSKLVLVDGGGQLRGYYDSADEAAVRRLLGDLRRL